MTQITLNPATLDQQRRDRLQAWALHCAEQAERAKARRNMNAWHWWARAADGGEEVG